jgi:hypothetical protein
MSLCAVLRNFSTGRSPKTKSGMAISLPILGKEVRFRKTTKGVVTLGSAQK